jgi:tetratricopeptide (TPR) repeat protein
MEALDIRRRELGENHADVATSLMHVAALVSDGGSHTADAIPLLQRALAIRRHLFGDADPLTTDALYQLASELHMAGRYKEARPLFDQWLELVRAQPPLFTPERAEQLGTMATIMQFTRQTERADTLQREVLKIDRALYGNAHYRVAADLSTLGSLEVDAGDMASGDTLLRQAVAMLRTSYPEGHPQLPHTLRDLGYMLVERERWPEADTVWQQAAAGYQKYKGTTSLDYVNALSFVALCATMRGRTAEAERMLRTVLASDVAKRPDPNPVVNRARLFLGRVLLDEGRVTEAEPLLLAAVGPKARTLSRASHRLAIQSLVDLYRAEGRPLDAARYAAARRP